MAEPTAAIGGRDQLTHALRQHGEQVVAALRDINPERLDPPRAGAGWGAHELLAHIASMEWTYPRLIEVAEAAGSQQPAEDPPTRAFRGGNDSYNDRQVARRAAEPADALIAEFERNRAALLEAVGAMEPSLLAVAIKSAGGIMGSLEQVLRSVAIDHVQEHLEEIGRITSPESSGQGKP